MTSCIKIGIYGWLLSHGLIIAAQGLIRLTAIEPGTEAVQLIPNGDFQSVAPSSEGPQAAGWTRQGQLAPSVGTNTSRANEGQVAGGKVDLHYPVSLLQRLVHLEPNTSYVLSAYLWNMGDPANSVNTVLDFNDAPGEPQLVLSSSNSGADSGYFAYRSFNTGTTGASITLRLFYDGLTGTGASAGYYPLAAQWDNIAITKAVEFIPPTPHGTGGNLRPRVRIDNPNSDDSLFFPTLPASVPIEATAT
ncbi:MAG TPA: hypothetical protein VMF06_22930, partial [Candidatus Limnocylindria bacterium]|nr:hypothetical protein [Candidatus Limnocylindria bacterium]